MLFFIITPLIMSGVFYASNGENKIAYIDCLFMVVSAMTVTGLNSVLLASLTLWQQIILFVRRTSRFWEDGKQSTKRCLFCPAPDVCRLDDDRVPYHHPHPSVRCFPS